MSLLPSKRGENLSSSSGTPSVVQKVEWGPPPAIHNLIGPNSYRGSPHSEVREEGSVSRGKHMRKDFLKIELEY